MTGVDELGLAGYFFGGTGNNNVDPTAMSNVEYLYSAWKTKHNGEAYYMPGVFSDYAPTGEKERSPWAPRSGWAVSPLATIGWEWLSVGLEGAQGKTTGARVDEMVKKLEIELVRGDKEVNVFGFSRGSTSALEFLNRIQDKVNAGDPRYAGIKINFVALWDVVKTTAVDYRTELPKGMHFEHQPIHFIALDEQRTAFFNPEVLNLQGAIQIGLRGVHSDAANAYENSPFGWVSLQTSVFLGKIADLEFDKATVSKYTGPTNWRAKPTDNSSFKYRFGHRTFPTDMYLHWSVKYFNQYSTPLNDITGHTELPHEVFRKW